MAFTPHNSSKDPCYYITLFKIEGHSTWRMHAGKSKAIFDSEVGNKTTVTDRKVLRINRVTGELTELV